MHCATADDIDLGKLNNSYRGVTVVKVIPLYDIHNEGEQTHFGLQIRLKQERRAKPGKVAPFYFDDEHEAARAMKILNEWSHSPDRS